MNIGQPWCVSISKVKANNPWATLCVIMSETSAVDGRRVHTSSKQHANMTWELKKIAFLQKKKRKGKGGSQVYMLFLASYSLLSAVGDV